MLSTRQQKLRNTQVLEHFCFALFSLPDLYKVLINSRITARWGQILIFFKVVIKAVSLQACEQIVGFLFPEEPTADSCISLHSPVQQRQRMHGCGCRIRRVMVPLNTPWQSQTVHLSPLKPPNQQWILPSHRNLKTAEFNNYNTLQLSCSYGNIF